MSTKKSDALKMMEKLTGGPLTIGRVLRAHRMSAEFTQAQMAKKIGISKEQLSDLENGRRGISPEKAAEYAKALKMSVPLYIKLALEDQLKRAGLKFEVSVKAA